MVDARLAPASEVYRGGGKLGLEEEIAMEECFGERNARYAQLEAKLESAQGRKLVDVVQAMVGLSWLDMIRHSSVIGLMLMLMI